MLPTHPDCSLPLDTAALQCLPERARDQREQPCQAELPRPVYHAALESLALVISSINWPHCQLPGTSFISAHRVPWGFPVTLAVNNLPAHVGDRRDRFDPWARKIPWRSAWQPTPVFLPGESHGQRSLAGYSPWGCKEPDVS